MEIVSQRHVPDIWSLTEDEWRDLRSVLIKTKKLLNPAYLPDGYNIGVNDGLAAGQTVMHLHIHIIPRYSGDVPNPRGGVRNIKEALVKY